MLPGLAAGGGSGVFFAAVLTEGSMGTRVTICGRGDWWGCLGIALAAACKLAMVFFTMRPSTDRAESMEGVAEVGVVAPREAMGAEREANFHGGPPEETKHLPNIEGAVGKGLYPGACL